MGKILNILKLFRYFNQPFLLTQLTLRLNLNNPQILHFSLQLHFLNLSISTISFKWFKIKGGGGGVGSNSSDVCDFYFLNILFDATLGLFINYHLLRLSQKRFRYVSGYYNDSPNEIVTTTTSYNEEENNDHDQQLLSHSPLLPEEEEEQLCNVASTNKLQTISGIFKQQNEWMRQITIWLIIVTTMKTISMTVILLFSRWLTAGAHRVLSPFE